MKQFWKNNRGHNDPVSKVQQLLEECQKILRRRSSSVHRGRVENIRRKSEKLKELQAREEPSALEEIKLLQKDLHLLLDQKDLKWKQRAKRYWYRNGDQNTKYFHACANQRRQKKPYKTGHR